MPAGASTCNPALFLGLSRCPADQPEISAGRLVPGPELPLQQAAKSNEARQRAQAGLAEAEASFRAMTAADKAAAKA